MQNPFTNNEELFLGVILDSKFNGQKYRKKTNLIIAVDISLSMQEKISVNKNENKEMLFL